MKHIVSFSGGRTSAYLVHLMEQKRINYSWDVEYVFMDTGAEHPKTYEFIKNVVKNFNIKITCLRYVASMEQGDGGTFEIVKLDDCKHDLKPFKGMIDKYGLPYLHGAFCSDRMKNVTFNKYLKSKNYKNYVTFLGIRFDEPKRIWGQGLDSGLTKRGLDEYSRSDLYDGAIRALDAGYGVESFMYESLSPMFDDDPLCDDLAERIHLLESKKIRYMACLTDFEKKDVLNWWENQSFNLAIDENLGNCVFCIKKGILKVADAVAKEPELAKQFDDMITQAKQSKDYKDRINTMYRNNNSFRSIAKLSENLDAKSLSQRIKITNIDTSNTCSESCEPLDQLDMFKETK